MSVAGSGGANDRSPPSLGSEPVGHGVRRLADLTDYFAPGMAVEDTITGLYAMTPDQNPIIDGRAGFVNVVGFSGHGFMHAPASGRIAADLTFDGETSLVDIAPFASERFDSGSAAEQSFI